MRAPAIGRFIGAHFVTVVGEWVVVLAALLHAYRWGGVRAVGPASVLMLVPPILGAPVVASVMNRWRPSTIRVTGFALQTAAYGAAGVASVAGAASPVVVACGFVGLTALCTLRPTGAALLPSLVESADQLLHTNLRITHTDSSCSLIGASLSAILGAIGGPSAMLFGGTATALVATLLSKPTASVGGSLPTPAEDHRHKGALRAALADLRARPSNIGALAMTAARNVVVGAFDALLVVLAIRRLGLGDSGPSVLTACVGAGALLSTVLTGRIAGRRRISSALLGAITVAAVGCLVLSQPFRPVVVYVALAVIGVSLSLLSGLSQILLQRSTDPRRLGPLFALLGLTVGAGQVVGAALAQIALALSTVGVAFGVLGVAIALLGFASAASVRRSDREAVVPVVEMAALARTSIFGQLPSSMLEAVARAATHRETAPAEPIVIQGEPADDFYAVSAGSFSVDIDGRRVRTLTTGEFFGEVALLTNGRRTATITSQTAGHLLVLEREPFLLSVTGHDISRHATARYLRAIDLDDATRQTAEATLR